MTIAPTVGTPFDDGLADDFTENIMCSFDSTHVGLLWRQDHRILGRFQYWLDVLALAADGLSLSRTARTVLIDEPPDWVETDPGNGGGFPQVLGTDFGAVTLVQAQPSVGPGALARISLVDSTGAINATLSPTVVDGFDYWIMFPVNGTTIGLLHVDDTQTNAEVHTLRVGATSLTLDPTTTATIVGCYCTQGPINGGGCFLGMASRFHTSRQAYVATDPGSGPLVLTAVSTVEQYEEGPAQNWGCTGPNPGQGAFLSFDSASNNAWVVVGHQSGGTFVTDSKVLFTDRLSFDLTVFASNGPMMVNRGGQIDIGAIPAGDPFGSSPGRVILDLLGDAVVVDLAGTDSAQFLAAPAPGRLVATMGWFGLVYPIALATTLYQRSLPRDDALGAGDARSWPPSTTAQSGVRSLPTAVF